MKADPEMRSELLFDFLDNIYKVSAASCGPDQRKECDKRIEKLEKRKKVDTALAGGGGVLGGLIAGIIHKIFG